MKISIGCRLCQTSAEIEVETPVGWADTEIVDVDALCPAHAAIQPFIESQCPGCVGGWGDCDLWRDFAYSGRRNLGERDFAEMHMGGCPRRTNGTMTVNMTARGAHIETLDLSEMAPAAAGMALAQAIRDYWERYPERPAASPGNRAEG